MDAIRPPLASHDRLRRDCPAAALQTNRATNPQEALWPNTCRVQLSTEEHIQCPRPPYPPPERLFRRLAYPQPRPENGSPNTDPMIPRRPRQRSTVVALLLLFLNPLAIVLLVAAVFSAFLGQTVDATIIVLVVALG